MSSVNIYEVRDNCWHNRLYHIKFKIYALFDISEAKRIFALYELILT
jgi:hypothetical protein